MNRASISSNKAGVHSRCYAELLIYFEYCSLRAYSKLPYYEVVSLSLSLPPSGKKFRCTALDNHSMGRDDLLGLGFFIYYTSPLALLTIHHPILCHANDVGYYTATTVRRETRKRVRLDMKIVYGQVCTRTEQPSSLLHSQLFLQTSTTNARRQAMIFSHRKGPIETLLQRKRFSFLIGHKQ